MMGGQFDISKTISKRFIPRKVEFSSYEIDYKDIKGQLLLLGILTSVLEVPKNQIPHNVPVPSDMPIYVIASQNIVTFVNEGKKYPPGPILTPEQIDKKSKDDITSIVVDSAREPFNEYLVSGNPPISLKTRTTLVKVELVLDTINVQGDPMLWVTQNTTHNVTIAKDAGSGIR